MADETPLPGGETPTAETPVTPTPEPGETPDPGTSPAEHEPEPAESDDETPPEAEPIPDPLEPLKNALAKERESHKTAAAEVKELRASLLEEQTQRIIRENSLDEKQQEFIRKQPDYENRLLAASAIRELRQMSAGKEVVPVWGRANTPAPEQKPPPDNLPMFKHKAFQAGRAYKPKSKD